ncbi:MAG: response regulator [Alkalispirochaetaceae bacterium]
MTIPKTRTSELNELLVRLTEVLGFGCYAHYERSEGGTIGLLSWGGPQCGKAGEAEFFFHDLPEKEAFGDPGGAIARTLVHELTSEDPLFDSAYPVGIRSYGIWPLTVGQKLLGYLFLGTEELATFDSRTVGILDLIAELVSWGMVSQRDRRERIRELILQLSEVEERERQRIAEVFHGDLQQLLAGAKVHVDIASRGVQEEPYLSERLRTATELLNDVIERSRTLSHDLSPATLERQGLLAALEVLAAQMGRTHGLSVDLSTVGELPTLPKRTTMIIYRAVQELLFNVAKHADCEDVSLRIVGGRDSCTIAVKDHGKGFDLEPTLSRRSSPGLGLVTVRDRIDAIGGVLEVDSKPGGGSSFTIRLEDVDRSGPRASERTATAGERATRVLVVDDHAVIRQGLALLLDGEEDITVVGEAESGLLAVEAVRTHRPDAVVMDYQMPEMDGADATRHIKEQFPETIVIGLSMHEDEETKRRMVEAGADAYLPKEGPSEQLIAAIRRYGPGTNGL